MRAELAADLPCSACGRGLLPGDVVIVTRDVPPSWAPAAGEATTIVHEACESTGGRADYNWTREPPQTLLHVLAGMSDGHRRKLERGRARGAPTSVKLG